MGDEALPHHLDLSALSRNLGEVAQDSETARWLRKAPRDAHPRTSETIYQALYAVSRRGRFRIFSDGRTEALPS
ncbi:hypothetical protein AB0425_33370 [Actinosynnema sp. NPDC051121]|nr:hypothetical protein [Saccharothrix sp.]